jgi:hypothetical protein
MHNDFTLFSMAVPSGKTAVYYYAYITQHLRLFCIGFLVMELNSFCPISFVSPRRPSAGVFLQYRQTDRRLFMFTFVFYFLPQMIVLLPY